MRNSPVTEPMIVGSVGFQSGFCVRYDSSSICSSPTITSPTMRPPTGPSLTPFPRTPPSFSTSFST